MAPTLLGWTILIGMFLLVIKLLEMLLKSCIEISEMSWGWSCFFGTIGVICAFIGWLSGNTAMACYSLGAALFLPTCIYSYRLILAHRKKLAKVKKAEELALYHKHFFNHS